METKTWMTPKRIARGPAAANAELNRWRTVRLEHQRTLPHVSTRFDSVAAMRTDEAASRRRGIGSRVVAEPVKGIDLLDIALTAGALAGAYLFWRVIKSTQTRDVVNGLPQRSTYELGLDALATR